MKRSLISFLLLAVIISCDDEPESTPFLTIENDADNSEALWIFASDDNGRIIDLQSITDQRPIRLKTSQKGLYRVDLTFAGVIETTTGKSFILNTYTNVATDRVVKINQTQPFAPLPMQGDLKVKLSNYHGDISNDSQLLFSILPDGYNTFGTREIINDLLVTNVRVPIAEGELVITGYRDGEPVYWKGAIEPGEILLDFNSFIPQQDVMSFSTAASASVYGTQYPGSNLVAALANVSQYPPVPQKIGYVPGFAHYITRIYNTGTEADNWVFATYEKFGARAKSFPNTKPTLEVIDKSADNFQLSGTTPHDYKKITWLFDDEINSIQWSVHTDERTEAKIKCNFPEFFKKEGSYVTKENLKNVFVELIVSNGTFTYNDLLNEKLYNQKNKEFERTTFSKFHFE